MRMYCPSCKKVTRWEVEEGYKSYYDNGESADNIKAFIRHRFCQGCDEAIRRGYPKHEGPIQTIKTAELDCEFISELVRLRKENRKLLIESDIKQNKLKHELHETIQRFKNAGTKIKEAIDTFEGTVEFSERSASKQFLEQLICDIYDLEPKDISSNTNGNMLRLKFMSQQNEIHSIIVSEKLREFEGDSISDESPLKTEVLEKIVEDPNIPDMAKLLAKFVLHYRKDLAALEVLREAGIPMPEEKDTETEGQE